MTIPSWNDFEVEWQINFVARNGDIYRLEILSDGYTGDIKYLRGADSPFETEEDNTEDPLFPIRKQVGTLRIADNGYDLNGNAFDYKELFPASCFDLQVRLWQEGQTDTLRWVGYILDGTLTSSLFEGVPIREYQLTCPIGMLYYLPFSFSNTPTNRGTAPTFGQLFSSAFSKLGIDWQYVHKTNNLPGRADLTSRVSLLNFCDENKPTYSGTGEGYSAKWEDKKTFGDVLQEICLFWGWTLMSRGLDIYFVARGQNRPFTTFAFSALVNTDTSLEEYVYELYDDNSIITIDTEDLEYVSTSHNESAGNGKKNIEIVADANTQDVVINPNLKQLEYDFVNLQNGATFAPDADPIILNGNYRSVNLATKQSYNSGFFSLDNYRLRISEVAITGAKRAFVVAMTDSWKYDEEKTSFSMKENIIVWQGNTDNVLSFSAETAEDILVPSDSVISISASAKPSADPSSSATFPENGLPINLVIKLGDKYYNGSNGVWQTSFASFQAVIDDSNNIKLMGRGLLDPYAGSSGYCIHVPKDESNPQGMCGRLKLEVRTLGGLSGASEPVLKALLINLKVGIYVKDDVIKPQCKDEQTFSGIASEDFREDFNLPLKMASGNLNKYGLGQVYDVNFNLLTGVPFINANATWNTAKPEERLLARLQSIYSSVTQQCTIEVLDNLSASLPDRRFDVSWRDNETFTMLACSHDWRNATMRLTLINK